MPFNCSSGPILVRCGWILPVIVVVSQEKFAGELTRWSTGGTRCARRIVCFTWLVVTIGCWSNGLSWRVRIQDPSGQTRGKDRTMSIWFSSSETHRWTLCKYVLHNRFCFSFKKKKHLPLVYFEILCLKFCVNCACRCVVCCIPALFAPARLLPNTILASADRPSNCLQLRLIKKTKNKKSMHTTIKKK